MGAGEGQPEADQAPCTGLAQVLPLQQRTFLLSRYPQHVKEAVKLSHRSPTKLDAQSQAPMVSCCHVRIGFMHKECICQECLSMRGCAGVAGDLQHADRTREQVEGAREQRALQHSPGPEASADGHPDGSAPRPEGPAQSPRRAHAWLHGHCPGAYQWLPHPRAGQVTS